VDSWLGRGEGVFDEWGKQQVMESRDEQALKRAAIAEKWCRDKIKK
jgi:hypothetical protein